MLVQGLIPHDLLCDGSDLPDPQVPGTPRRTSYTTYYNAPLGARVFAEHTAAVVYRHVSAWVAEPLAGVVIWLFGSDSQVVAPLYLRMNLYWTAVVAGRLTVTVQGRDVNHRY